MSAARLNFLYPHLFRSLRLGEQASSATVTATATATASCSASTGGAYGRRRPRRAGSCPYGYGYAAASFSTSRPSKRASFAPRHGKAVEPLPLNAEQEAKGTPVGETGDAPAAGERKAEGESASESDSKAGLSSGTHTASESGSGQSGEKARAQEPSPHELSQQAEPAQEPQQEPQQPAPSGDAVASQEAAAQSQDAKEQAKKSGPMEAVLQMPPPEVVSKQHPHLSPPPYVHHFDSYTMVKQLDEGGYTTEQAVTAMKAIRGLLAVNLDVAQDSLVSKSDVENESYLFRAACSELSTEVKAKRRAADEQMRQQRTLLQHEVDILQQTIGHELLTLNDNVRGMFNDRKMAVREEQKAGDSAIQQISYKLSIDLSSDAKSDIESLRWVLIRRSVLGIIFMAVLTLGTLRYATYLAHEKQREADQRAREEESRRRGEGPRDHASAPDAAEMLAAN